jgi:GxxExxY protein
MSEVSDLLYTLTGKAMDLHDRLGCDHQEHIYHRMLFSHLLKLGYRVQFKPRLVIRDANHRQVAYYQPDLRVIAGELQVLIELKADPKGIPEADKRQARAYLKSSPRDAAVLLLNFGTERLGQYRKYQDAVLGERE